MFRASVIGMLLVVMEGCALWVVCSVRVLFMLHDDVDCLQDIPRAARGFMHSFVGYAAP